MELLLVTWWLNFIGIFLSGTGASILAYDVFSFKVNYPIGSWGEDMERAAHMNKNQKTIKAALILIPLGAICQLLAMLLSY
jgi:hypothetical protein